MIDGTVLRRSNCILILDLYTKYGDIVQEVTGSGVSIIHLYNRIDIGKIIVLKNVVLVH